MRTALIDYGSGNIASAAKALARAAGDAGDQEIIVTADPAARFGIGADAVGRVLDRLLADGTLVRGAFRPEGTEREWCDAEVLRQLRQRSLAVLRRELDRNPDDPLLYDRLADFLQQNNFAAQQEEVYRRALARFSNTSFYGKLARFYLRQKREQDFTTLTRHVVDTFHGTDLDIVLRANGIDTLVLAGIATSGVVLSTVRHAADNDYRLVVVEDHYPEGGIGGAVLEALNEAGHPVPVAHLAVQGLPGSGTPAELMDAAGISADQVAQAARDLLAAAPRRTSRGRGAQTSGASRGRRAPSSGAARGRRG